jgi:hypothetical protein
MRPFPLLPAALGVRITGVDDATYSQTGESYSAICLPNANTHTERVLQEDNTDLAYEALCAFQTNHHSPTTLTPTRACLRSSRASFVRAACVEHIPPCSILAPAFMH